LRRLFFLTPDFLETDIHVKEAVVGKQRLGLLDGMAGSVDPLSLA
jgi:hypothetical protein